MINFGSVPIGSVLPIPFAAYAAATGASVTLTGLEVTDIEVYKGTSMTQRASDNGYALLDTDGIDIDGITGIHGFSIDTSDNSDSGFYSAGAFYSVVVSAVTIDSQTVNFIAATFRLVAAENTAGLPVSDATRIGGATQTAANIGELANRLATMIEAAAGSPGEFRFTADALARLQTVIGMSAGNLDAQLAGLSSRLPAALVSGRMASDMIAISGDTVAADNLETSFDDTAGAVPWMGIVDQGTAQTATSTTLQLRSAAAFANDELIGAVIVITGGSTGVGQAREILDYVASTDTATVAAWTTTPTGTITYKIFASPPQDTTASDIKAVTDKLNTTLEAASGSPGDYRFSADALVRAPSGGLDAAGIRAAVGLASPNLDTQLQAIDDYVDTEVASIKTVTDKLGTMFEPATGSPGEFRYSYDALRNAPTGSGGGGGGGTDWSDGEREQIRHRLGIDGAASAPSATPSLATAASVATVTGYIDTEVGAIKVATDRFLTMIEPASGSPGEFKFTPDALRAVISVVPTAIQNADALLDRDMAAVNDTNARSPLNALRFLRNKWSLSGTTLTVTKENDSTTAWVATVSTTPGADPITGNDPA